MSAPNVVIVERIPPPSPLGLPTPLPAYCIHGETFCARCSRAVWLGNKTLEAVQGGALPLCMECANEVIPEERKREPRRNLGDHRRADGPHE
jgi:hypothetical protein